MAIHGYRFGPGESEDSGRSISGGVYRDLTVQRSPVCGGACDNRTGYGRAGLYSGKEAYELEDSIFGVRGKYEQAEGGSRAMVRGGEGSCRSLASFGGSSSGSV